MNGDEPRAFDGDKWGMGQPQGALLNAWAREVELAFGDVPYLVGSVCYTKTWRDVDVAVILDDEKWDHLFGPYIEGDQRAMARQRSGGWHNPFLAAMQIAFATWGREATGLPIDFKIQRRTQANAEFAKRPRSALGIMPHDSYAPAWRNRP